MNNPIQPSACFGAATLNQGEALSFLRGLPPQSVDLILTDPPYFNVLTRESWDCQWPTVEDYARWMGGVGAEFARVLKPSGAALIFQHSRWAAYVQVELDLHLAFKNTLVWRKTNSIQAMRAKCYRFFALTSERCLYYGHPGEPGPASDQIKESRTNFAALRVYFDQLRQATGLTVAEIAAKLGTSGADHALRPGAKQWYLPKREVYEALVELAPEFPARPWADLEAEYRGECTVQAAAIGQRRAFNYEGLMEVIDWPQSSANRLHPAQKPLGLIRALMRTCSNPGDLVVDPFSGSCTTGVAAIHEGRKFLGVERDPLYFDKACRRLEAAANLGELPPEPHPRAKPGKNQPKKRR